MLALMLGGFIFGKRYAESTQLAKSLKSENNSLLKQVHKRDSLILILSFDTTSLILTINNLNKSFAEKDKYIKVLKKQRDEILAKLEGITSDSIYQFLQQVAYNTPGELKYKFNDPQIRSIQGDYEVARNAEKIIPALSDQIDTCSREVYKYSVLTTNLRKTINLQSDNINDYRLVVSNDSTLIDAQRKVIVKEVRRKNFWKITSGVVTVALIAVII